MPVDADLDAFAAPPESLRARPAWDVYAIALEDDPHVRWRALRESTPVLDTGGGVFFLTRWSDVDACLRDARHGAGAGVAASFGAEAGLVHDVMRAWLMSLDGPPQQRARDLVRREFTPRRIEGLRALASEITDRLVSRMEQASPGEPVDLIPSLAFALPSELIRVLFGIPLDEWRDGVEQVVRRAGDGAIDGIAMIEGIARDFEARLRSGRVPEGLLSRLCAPDAELGALSSLEVVANAVLLVTAAIDTTAGLIGNAVDCLLDRPALVERLRAEPALIPAVIEETLRFEPPALSCSRSAGADLDIEGVAIPAGSQLLLGLAAANRDPRQFASPDVFDVDRDGGGLVSFGGGRHFCLGASLARMEAAVALERLLVRADVDWQRAGAPRWQKRNPTIRARESLPISTSTSTSSSIVGRPTRTMTDRSA